MKTPDETMHDLFDYLRANWKELGYSTEQACINTFADNILELKERCQEQGLVKSVQAYSAFLKRVD